MKKRILAVDDELLNLQLLERILAPLDCEIVRAVNGSEALNRFAACDPDLVLLDRRMPVMDGIEVLRHLRKPGIPWVPVVLITADGDREARLQGLEAGADDFIEKPVDRPVLLARARTLMSLRDAQKTLAERAEALRELDYQRRDLVRFIVHDLKNPLSVIRTNLAFVEREPERLSSHSTEALRDAGHAAHRMTGLVLDLLTIERMEHADLVLDRRPVDLGALAMDVAQVHRREAALQAVTLRVEARRRTVMADPALIRRVVENLVDNALHHTPDGGAIELGVDDSPEPALVVANTGRPIPAAVRPQLFDKFVRGEDGSTSRFGIGLHFCQRVAAAHAGSIGLVERRPWPVAFRLALPA